MTIEQGPRFGVWAQTEGTWHSLHHPTDPFDASWRRNRDQVLEAEALGFETTLLAQHTINPYGDDYEELEPWTAAAALAGLTDRIELIVAIKPYLYHPVVLAKMALQIEEISEGRAAINLVNAWYRPELERSGIGFADHDERYAYGREWLEVVRPLLGGERTTHQGRYFDVRDYQLRPSSQWRPRPRVYLGGESEPARQLAADAADVWFLNGKPLAAIQALVDDARSRPRPGPPLEFGMSAFVIARSTEREAQEELTYLFELADVDRTDLDHLRRNADPSSVMLQAVIAQPHVGTNGGTLAGLVGSYDQVAAGIQRFHEAGIGTFMLQFQPFEPEMRRFAAEVAPRARASGGSTSVSGSKQVWYTRCPSPTASSIALAGGFLDAALLGTGVELRSLADSAQRSVRQSHFTQEQAAQFRHGGVVPPLWAASRGAPIRLLGISEVPRSQWVITLPDRGIHRTADLRGARLGLPRRTTEPVDFWWAHCRRGLTLALAEVGLGEEDVTWVDLPTSEPYHADGPRPAGSSLWTAREAARLQRPEVHALVRGDVDAIYTYAPTGLGLIELLGAQVVLELGRHGPGSIGTLSVLTVGSSVLEEDGEIVTRYLGGLLRAADWAAAHPADTIRTFAAEEGVAEQWAAATFGTPRRLDLRPSLDTPLVESLQAEADFLHDQGVLASRLDVAAWAEPAPLSRATAELGGLRGPHPSPVVSSTKEHS